MIMPYNDTHHDCLADFSEQTYKQRLNRWTIVRLLPDKEQRVVARFRTRSDADGYLRSLTRQFPNDHFLVIFSQ